ncbi:uncharacterized protein LOC135150445 [Daucus carota subsp. sativus]|uniref:uncharacterized protein LOC135150445 n=1 Tax=Daucus carota subsp. sativus TaxID=79200 RepID=UPI003083E665
MDGYVNVNFFWGGEIIKQDNDVLYTLDPKEMMYVKLSSSLEELRDMVFGLMHISRHHWDVKLSVKYPRIGVSNLVSGFFVKSVKSGLVTSFHLGGDVSLFIETESIAQSSQHYGGEYGGNYGQTGQTAAGGQVSNYVENYGGSFGGDYGGNYGQSQGMQGWSSGYNYGTIGEYGGGSSNTGRFVVEEVVDEDDLSGRQPSPARQTPKRGAAIALALENEEDDEEYGSERAISSSDDSEWNLSQEDVPESEDFSEVDSDEEREGNMHLQTQALSIHEPRATWFGSQDYEPVIVSNKDAVMSLGFDPAADELTEGALFATKEVLIAAVKHAHISTDRNFIVEKSSTQVYKVKCVVSNCKWKLRAAKKKSHGLFQITKCPEIHTCLLDRPTQDHRKISAKMIGYVVAPYISQTPQLKVSNIITMVNDEYHHLVSYLKAWRGKMAAMESVYGSWKTTYNELPRFLNVMASTNVGSIVVVEVVPHHKERGTSTFVRAFWCLKAMIDGWQYARPVISIDGTFLKGKYNGKLLVAVGVDSNNHQYPICFALVDEETTENWSWFLRLLRRHVCRDRLGVCIISDRATGILAAMNDEASGFTPPMGYHRFCLHHVRSNFSKAFPGKELKMYMWLAGNTPQIRKYDAYMKKIGELSPQGLRWLLGISPALWTICHDTGHARFGQATTNITESFNGNVRVARHLPVTAMIEFMFYKTVRTVNKERNAVLEGIGEGHELCLRTRNKLEKIAAKANTHWVETFN